MINEEIIKKLQELDPKKQVVFIDNFGEKHYINSVKISNDKETIKICEF